LVITTLLLNLATSNPATADGHESKEDSAEEEKSLSLLEELRSERERARNDGAPHRFPDTAYEYAKLIEPDLGVPPKVDLGEGVEVITYVDGEPVTGKTDREICDNPTQIGGDCISGSSVQRHEGRTAEGEPLPNVIWASFGRHANFTFPNGYFLQGSVQMIGHNRKTGATAFFESSDAIHPWAHTEPETNRMLGVMPGIDEPEEFNRAYQAPGEVQCIMCHQNDPFIHSFFIDAAKMPGSKRPVIPQLKKAGRNIESHLPYYVIGGEDWDMRTLHIEGNECLDCHRVGMSTIDLYMSFEIGDWAPNEHMPPYDPGSLREHFDELMNCWENGPENTPGCDWIIPRAGDTPGRVVGDEYPFKESFNKPGKFRRIQEAVKEAGKEGRKKDEEKKEG
jgi:hypothetical protein